MFVQLNLCTTAGVCLLIEIDVCQDGYVWRIKMTGKDLQDVG